MVYQTSLWLTYKYKSECNACFNKIQLQKFRHKLNFNKTKMVQGKLLHGPVEKVPEEGKSLGEIFYKALKDAPSTKPILVNALTEESFSGGDILRKSLEVAVKLLELGARQGDMIAIISENCIEYIFSILGCFFIGAPINLLSPDYVFREVKHTIDISRPKFVITSQGKHQDALEVKNNVDFIEKVMTFEDLHCNNNESIEQLEKKLKISNGKDFNTKTHLALVLCSSGTTGLPKCVAITHENCKHAFLWMNSPSGAGLNSDEAIIAMLPFYHIMGFLTVISCLLFESKAIVIQKFKPDIFLKAIESQKITKLLVVPPLALFLAKSPTTDNYNLSSIKDIICGAAPLGAETQLALEQKIGVSIRQAYGLTEVGAASMTPPKGAQLPGNSGKALLNTTIKIVDIDTHETVAANQTGEIRVKSPTVMKCYLGNQKATEDVFDDEGFFCTGDIGYYNNDGYIFIVDRLKELIKYKGFQVPPAELEDILMAHEEIIEAAVIGVPDERAGELAKAFVKKRENCQLTEEDVVKYIAQHVSFQKQLHGGVEFIENIPKNAAGKILRRELRKLAGQ